MTVPYLFATQSGTIALSELDANFANVKALADGANIVTNSYQPNIGRIDNLTVSTLSATGNVTVDSMIKGTGPLNILTTNTGNVVGYSQLQWSSNISNPNGGQNNSLRVSSTGIQLQSANIAAARTYTWQFKNDGNLLLTGGGSLSIGLSQSSCQLQGGAGGYAGLTNQNLYNYVYVNDTAVYITTDYLINGYTWRFDQNGNLTLPGNTFSVNYANGTPVNISSGGGGNANTANMVFYDTTMYVAANTASQYLNIAYNGEGYSYLSLPSDSMANTSNTVLTNTAGNVQIGTGNATGSGGYYNWTFGNDGIVTFPDNTIMGNLEGANTFGFYSNNANIQYLLGASGNTWVFDGATGDLTLPGNIITGGDSGNITGANVVTANTFGITTNGGSLYGTVTESTVSVPGGSSNSIELTPAGGSDVDQRLVVYPTVANNHLHLTSGNIQNTELYLGDNYQYVKLANTGNVEITSFLGFGNTWVFDTNAQLTAPGTIAAMNNLVVDSNDTEGGQIVLGWPNVSGLIGQSSRTWNLDVDSSNNFRAFYVDAVGNSNVVLSLNSTTNTASFSSNVSIGGITQLGVYTAAAIANITGAVGQMVSISDSPSNGGKLAYWDTTNSRWSYVKDDSAV